MEIHIDHGLIFPQEYLMDTDTTQNNTILFQEDNELIASIRNITEYLFKQVLKKDLPEHIRIIIGEREKDPIAMFKSKSSSESSFMFQLNERVIEKWNNRDFAFHFIFLHELIHAADIKMIQKSFAYEEYLKMSWKKFHVWRLKRFLYILYRFRTEGIAELGTRLLYNRDIKPHECKEDVDFWKKQIEENAQFDQNADIEQFSQLFDKILSSNVRLTKELKEETEKKAYKYGTAVILRVLRNLQLISKIDEERVCAFLRWDGKRQLQLRDGNVPSESQQEMPDMSLEDRTKVMNACFSLNLPLFLEGLLLCREENPMVSVSQVLELCGNAQMCCSYDKIALFSELITHPHQTVKDFNKIMRVLAGRPMKEESLTRKMNELNEYPGWPTYWNLKEKINRLYAYYLENKDTGRKPQSLAAQHALHYFFKVKNLIVDYMPAFGFVDDLLIVDTALDILKKEENTTIP